MNTRRKGRIGEDIAAGYLKKEGFRILEKNFRCRMGEIDIVAKKGRDVHFVEVKYRKDQLYGSPFESITSAKIRQIVKVARYFLSKYRGDVSYHFSVIGVSGEDGVDIEFLPDAFEAP